MRQVRGADVAAYQGVIHFDALKDNVEFVICKATEGVGFLDARFDRNWSEAKRVGLIRGAYHFARPDLGNSAEDEATYFLSRLGPLAGEDLLALDYEASWDGDVVGWCLEFLGRVRAVTGTSPFIYLNRSLVRDHDWSSVISAGFPLWLAAYDDDPVTMPPTPWPLVTIKQWTSSGTLAGIPGRVDLDTWQIADPPEEPPKEEPHVDETPQRVGQSADLMLRPGELGMLQGIYAYPAHPESRAIVWKVRGTKLGRTVIYMYPPVEPDADATMLIGAEPCVFIVDVLP